MQQMKIAKSQLIGYAWKHGQETSEEQKEIGGEQIPNKSIFSKSEIFILARERGGKRENGHFWLSFSD